MLKLFLLDLPFHSGTLLDARGMILQITFALLRCGALSCASPTPNVPFTTTPVYCHDMDEHGTVMIRLLRTRCCGREYHQQISHCRPCALPIRLNICWHQVMFRPEGCSHSFVERLMVLSSLTQDFSARSSVHSPMSSCPQKSPKPFVL